MADEVELRVASYITRRVAAVMASPSVRASASAALAEGRARLEAEVAAIVAEEAAAAAAPVVEAAQAAAAARLAELSAAADARKQEEEAARRRKEAAAAAGPVAGDGGKVSFRLGGPKRR